MEEKPIEAIEGEAVEKLEAAGGTLTGKLQWQGFLPTDLAELATVLLQICQGTAESNDFLKLVFKDVDPGEAAIMSCWEFVFYVAYRAGAIDREYLQTLFKLASQKAKTVYNKILTTTATPLAIRYGGFGSIPILQMKTHQKNALNYAFQGFCQVIEPELGVSTQQKWTEGEIPSGCVVFFNRWLDHTALSLGMKDGQQKILTLWPHPTVVEMNLDDLVTHIVSLRRPKPTIYFTNPPWL
ncbi:hypothetical protein [Synechococcus sp. PCC 7336]|uniref:hypothetical protein n=1 Tax=Synechococcus sp. PCC 7336 TaxID=195250 RepID=UPI0012EA5E13|nr:hypothetical protein [Synechococcus sp. PCC 7336]